MSIVLKINQALNYQQLIMLTLINLDIYIKELLNSDKQIKENNNLELIDNYLLDKDIQEPSNEILMAADLIDDYALDKRFMRELEDRDQYEAA